ncbi:MAG: RNA polymerase sigma factor [Conexibacteraceae bacterium]|nr:RNA polymerase sigma factor [Conexibacteraceae bacterium]
MTKSADIAPCARMRMGEGAGARAGIDALYAELAPQLVRIVATNLRAPDSVIDDACQSAWGALLVSRATVAPGSELRWLSTSATRVALRILRSQQRAVSLDDVSALVRLDDHRPAEPGPERRLELRERLAEVRQLPVRQQRIVLLSGMGYDHVEIAAVTGDSRRTVHRQLNRARQRLARLVSEG